MGVLLTLLAFGHPWLHRAPKAPQQYPHPMSQPTAGVVVTGKHPGHRL